MIRTDGKQTIANSPRRKRIRPRHPERTDRAYECETAARVRDAVELAATLGRIRRSTFGYRDDLFHGECPLPTSAIPPNEGIAPRHFLKDEQDNARLRRALERVGLRKRRDQVPVWDTRTEYEQESGDH